MGTETDFRLSVIVPAYTERESLRHNVRRVLEDNGGRVLEVIIVVPPAADPGTLEVCRELAASDARIAVHVQRENPGLGRALREAFALARGTHVQVLWADSEADAGAVRAFVDRALETGADVVVGSRWMPGAEVHRYPPVRWFFNRAFQAVFRLLYGTRLHDLTLGFDLLRADLVRRIRWTGTRHEIAAEMALKPLRLGCRVEEVPVVWRRRSEGQSKLKLTRYLLYPFMALKIRFSPRRSILRGEGGAPGAGFPWERLALAAAVALGGWLRLKGLAFQSFWFDELVTLYHSSPRLGLAHAVDYCRTIEHTPPLYYALLWAWQSLWGTGEWSARLLPALIGIAGIPAAWFLGRRVVSREAGACAALIAAVLPFHLHYSQEVRSYTLLFFLAALSWGLLAGLLRGGGRRDAVLYALVTSLATWTHYYGLFIFAAQLGFTAMFAAAAGRGERRAALRRAWPSMAAVAVLFIPWLPAVPRLFGLRTFWAKPPGAAFFAEYFKHFFGFEPYAIYLSAFLVAVWLAGEGERESFPRARLMLFSWLFLVLAIPYLRSFGHPAPVQPRYAMAVLPAVLVMAAGGLTRLRDHALRLFVLGTLLAALLVNTFLTRGSYYSKVTKQQWREAAAFVVGRDPQGRYPVRAYDFTAYYLSWLMGSPAGMGPRITTPKEARSARREVNLGKVPGLWVLDGHKVMDEKARRLLDRRLKVAADASFKDVRATLYVRKERVRAAAKGGGKAVQKRSGRR